MDILNKLKTSVVEGFKAGINTTFFMLKVIIPITFIVTILKHSNLLGYLTIIFEPLMKLFGLPKEAALALILGNFINIYGAIAVIESISLTSKQITIIALMLLFSHSLLVETTVTSKLDIPKRIIIIVRITSALVAGIVLNIIL